ncbi:MAG: hypothetical protein ACYTF6_09975 [Planctomycetota bacterium]|jgi:hypothetical protein
MLRQISHELKHHAPFTLGGTVVGAGVMAAMAYGSAPRELSQALFGLFHPLHVLLSAVATAGLYRLHTKGRWWRTIAIGYLGAVGIATLSDSLIPYLGEILFGLASEHVHGEAHIGFIELWWLVNPLALVGALMGLVWPRSTFPHAGHVLLSTAASLFHMTMALDHGVAVHTIVALLVFLFLAVWVPCCTSDIVFPLMFVSKKAPREGAGAPAADSD